MKSIYINKIAPLCALSLLMVGAASHAQQFSGVVLDADGNRIAKAKVSLVNTKYKVVTDEKGQFTFSDVGVGKVEVHVSAKNFSHINEYFTITDKDMTEVKISLRATVMEVVDVYATPLHSSSIESALPVNVISGDDLRLKQASTLGETLKNEVGVHSSYFGPVASSPIIRGMDGPRVLITQNGLDVGDASRVGPDHAVAAEAGTAQQVEVLRGPSTLFYGSGAIGGVVNVVDNRIPKTIDNQVDYLLKHNDVADESEATLSINTGYKSLALHLDAFWRESNDYKIPGYATAAEDHDEHEEDHDEHEEDHDEHEEDHDEHEEDHDEHEGEETKGILENSASKSSGFTVGSSYLFDAGYIGVSYGRMERTYGIPGHSEHGDEEHEETGTEISEEGAVFGDLVQDRYQLLSEISFEDSFINRLISKAAYTDYQHQEIEGGEVGTQFNNEMLETRFDLYHQAVDGWKGAWTLHYKENDFKAIGEEAFTPPSNTESIAVAWLEEKHVDNVLWQVGVRVEHVELSASGAVDLHDEHDDELDNHNEAAVYFDKQSFTPISASLGAVWEYSTGYNLGFSAAFSQRAPSASELFSNGAHIGTSTYEVGALFTVHEESHEEHHELHVDLSDQNVELETAYNLDLTWRKFEGDFGFVASAFYNHIDDYYYQANTGLFAEDGHDSHDEAVEDDHADESEGLPVYVFQQNNVVMYGVEAELFYQLTPTLKATVFTDYIRAKLTDNDNNNLPRIPPMRVGGQFNYVTDKYSAELSATHYFEQSDTAELESKTSGYTMIDANINFFIDGLGDDMVAFLKVNNITDEEARVHTSFLKNVSPLPARGFTVGIRGSF